MKMWRGLAAAVAGVALASSASAAQLIVTNGVLMGANGVTVGTNTYNVTFADGTCTTVFGTCAAASFAFTASADATAAAQALLDQVFLDTPEGNFDAAITNIYGGGSAAKYDAIIPFAAGGGSLSVAVARNLSGTNPDTVFTGSYTLGADTTISNSLAYARFTLSPAPEPASWAMMLVGFGLVGVGLRRRRTAVIFG